MNDAGNDLIHEVDGGIVILLIATTTAGLLELRGLKDPVVSRANFSFCPVKKSDVGFLGAKLTLEAEEFRVKSVLDVDWLEMLGDNGGYWLLDWLLYHWLEGLLLVPQGDTSSTLAPCHGLF